MRNNKKNKKRKKQSKDVPIKYDDFHAQVLHHINNGVIPNTAIYNENPRHLASIIGQYAKRDHHNTILEIAQGAINTVLQKNEPLSHKESKPFNPAAVGMAALMLTAATDAVWAYLTHTNVGFDGQKTDNFWEQSGAQQVYTFLTAMVIMPLVMLAIAKKYNLELKEAARISANVAIATVISVIPFNIFAKYGPELLKWLGVDALLADTLSFLFPGIIEGPVQAISLVIGNLISDRNYIFDKIEFAIAVSPLSWVFGTAWQGMFQLISGSSIPEPYRTALVATGVPSVDTLALYASILMINATTNHIKEKQLDAIADNPEIITDHPICRVEAKAIDITRDIARPMTTGVVAMLQRFGGLFQQQQPNLTAQPTAGLRENATQLMSYLRSKLFS